MPVLLSDVDIARLLVETKKLPNDYRSRIQIKPKRDHKERELDIIGDSGSHFRLILRQSELNALDFSIIIAYKLPNSNTYFRMRRYNGKSHEHTNTLEKITFYDFHIHMATERYQQESGQREDTYAEPTDRYADMASAIQCMIDDCGFEVEPTSQMTLFNE